MWILIVICNLSNVFNLHEKSGQTGFWLNISDLPLLKFVCYYPDFSIGSHKFQAQISAVFMWL